MSFDGDVRDDERRRRLEAVTDDKLSRLDASDLLDELLERVRSLLGADTATILLLDTNTGHLVATAAKGLEEEAREGMRIPVSEGLAGRVARTRQPQAVADVKPGEAANRIPLEKGMRSLLSVPILVAGEVVGVLQVGTRAPRQFTDDDVSLMRLAAERARVAGQIRSGKLEQAAALALQRSLLPPKLPTLAGLDLAARYVPGHEFGVGGDWYDVFTLPSGWVGMVIGDVSGHGLASAVVMGRIRSALRAYTLISDDPAEVLALLDRKVHHFEAGSLTTALYATISPDRTTVRLSSAGHLRPILTAPGLAADLVEMPIDAPLGIGRWKGTRRTTTLDLPAGGLMLGYTDGLVERRDQIIDVGIKALVEVVRPGDPEELCATLMSRIGGDQPTDDVAVIAMARTGRRP
jgi:putative methionine-R-sulfoxide reductase with GAF domain